ncbi:CopG family transcriptional regulator [Dietzia sp. 179-F 9C3 NHS]|uniref:CopG family transcriptional regulator n=1 Tax=Dietzia sp. 179-F 9C3 NHS TaxID=3374295 RepID=UPI003879DF44
MRTNVYSEPDEDGERTLLGWFDPDKTQWWRDELRWDGNNRTSVATRQYGVRESLGKTPGGRWLIERTSAWQGAQTRHTFVTDGRAREWLVINDYSADAIVAAGLGEVGDEAGPAPVGRPTVGDRSIKLLMDSSQLTEVDRAAGRAGLSRAEWIRRACARALEEEG